MSKRSIYLLFVVGLTLIGVSLLMLSGVIVSAQEDAPDPAAAALGEPPVFLTSIYEAWVSSAHARFEDEVFHHWDEEADQVIPESCARCHSTPGYRDYVGADGSEIGVVNAPAPLGTVINCDACHNSGTIALTSVTFPSGVEINNLEDSSRCMVCHQGRESGLSVINAIETAGLTDSPNTVSEDLRFINIHYYAAAASLYGGEVMGGYQFEGKSYHMRNQHVEGYNTCAGCHNPHTLELKVDECANCHDGVETVEDLQNIRSVGSNVDYDGDGNMEEGIAGEIETLQEMLYTAMQVYAENVVGTPIIYDAGSYPYFFADMDGDGAVSEGDGRYSTFTPVLLQAAYNYQVTQKDPGKFAHNPDYHIELLYDSIESINAQLEEGAGVDLSTASRESSGHFNGSAEAFRHWDEDGMVEAPCTRCHSADGLPFFIEHGVLIEQEVSNSLACITCHENPAEGIVYSVASVTFPSGLEASFGEDSPSNICIECHQGRESNTSITALIDAAGAGDDEVSPALRFRNPHYFVTGATLFGTQAQGPFQYPDQEYNGRNEHTRRFDECSDCHDQHTGTIRFEECSDCHEAVEVPEDVLNIRAHPDDKDRVDYDGDGDMDEPIRAEIETLDNDLYARIQAYAADVIGTPIAKGTGYPYWFIDTNGNGEVDADEGVRDNAYPSWTPRLLRAVYNYQFIYADPGAFAHNPDYVLQVLYDSVKDIGGEEAVATYTRPEVRPIEE
jgi:hypothetical protein